MFFLIQTLLAFLTMGLNDAQQHNVHDRRLNNLHLKSDFLTQIYLCLQNNILCAHKNTQ